MSEHRNAAFDPPNASGNPANVRYTVGTVTGGVKVGAKFRAVSRAGVAEADWEQPTRSFQLNRIAGNFSGEHTQTAGRKLTLSA